MWSGTLELLVAGGKLYGSCPLVRGSKLQYPVYLTRVLHSAQELSTRTRLLWSCRARVLPARSLCRSAEVQRCWAALTDWAPQHKVASEALVPLFRKKGMATL